jgi:diguanylate cyclase (GGDEF)-like protein
MRAPKDISLRQGIAVLVAVLAVLAGGTWLAVTVTTKQLMNSEAMSTARDWAHYLAKNVSDLENIASGEQPSAASMAFFQGTRHAGQVFRYVIYNREGYSQLISERDRIAPVDLSEFNADAALAASSGQSIVNVQEAQPGEGPAIFARAYVPAMTHDHVVAVVAAYVDETEQSAVYRKNALLSAITIWILAGLSFGIPAIAWYHRTKEKQQADRRIQFLAHHDILTGLANRAQLAERIESALAALQDTGRTVAVHFIDIDHFKEVNDTLGHDGGDYLLRCIGQRLRGLMIRSEDFVARLGGDEFVIVQTGIFGPEQTEPFAHRIASVLAAPISFKNHEITPSVTIGVAIAPIGGTTPDQLLKSADLALYNGKSAGRNCVRNFTPEMEEALKTRIVLEKTVRDAIGNGNLDLHYQPIYEVSRKQLVGFEALVRLPGPNGTLISPAVFIPITEEIHLTNKVSEWVLREACKTATTWPDHLTVSVNLSPADFATGAIVDTVADALTKSGLEPHRLELEITETLLLGNNEQTLNDLKELKAMGIAIVMDDFGTGYSSLSYLWKFPFDKIKIDRSFMENFKKAGGDVKTVVKAVIALAREMRMRVTIEGVENASQVDFLYETDADQVQGFYFGKPVPAARIATDVLTGTRKISPKRPGTAYPKVAAVAAQA